MEKLLEKRIERLIEGLENRIKLEEETIKEYKNDEVFEFMVTNSQSRIVGLKWAIQDIKSALEMGFIK